jgi:hypothetical protein
MSLTVKHAVYGALPNGQQNHAEAFDVTQPLQRLLNRGGIDSGIVVCNNNSFGDPSPGNVKHFGAVVNRDGFDFAFACLEGQTINFTDAGGPVLKSNLAVKFAVYGALPAGIGSNAEASDVTLLLQQLLNENHIVQCTNENFGDPSPNNVKHFAAIVTRGAQDVRFACQEGQTIDFATGGGV